MSITNPPSFRVYTECKLHKPRKLYKISIHYNNPYKKTTIFAKGFYSSIIKRECHYSQRGFHTVECESNIGEGRVSNFIFLVEAGGGGSLL